MAEAVLKTKENYLDRWKALSEQQAPAWLQELRNSSLKSFQAAELPHTKMEEWRQTNIAGINNTAFTSLVAPPDHGVTRKTITNLHFGQADWHELVLVDGYFSSELSSLEDLQDGVVLAGLADQAESPVVREHLNQYLQQRNAYTLLNSAFLQDGALVYVPANLTVDKPIHVVFVTSKREAQTAAHPRLLCVLDQSAAATVVTSHISLAGDNMYFNNVVEELVVGANAQLDYYRLIQESEGGNHLATTEVHQARDSRFTAFTFSLHGKIVRNQLCAKLDGEGADSSLHGLYLNEKDHLADNMVHIDHVQPHGTSRIAYKGILDDTSKAVFTGKVYVDRIAQQTDSNQLSNNFLLSDKATIDSKPQLEIYADDVKCTHGTTVGAPPKEVVFYFRSRGIDEKTAHAMLTYGFADEVVGDVGLAPLAEQLDRFLHQKYSPRV